MPLPNYVQVGPALGADGTQMAARAGRLGDSIVSELHGRYYEQAVRGNLFVARAIVTAPVIFSTAAGTGGPLLWNGSTNRNAVILGIGVPHTVVTTVAAALGLTGAAGQVSAPGSTTAIDTTSNLFIGGSASACTAYRVGTPTNAGTFFWPLAQVHTGALTVDTFGNGWIDVGGALIVPPQCWCSIAASATATTLVGQFSMVWEEVPV